MKSTFELDGIFYIRPRGIIRAIIEIIDPLENPTDAEWKCLLSEEIVDFPWLKYGKIVFRSGAKFR